jgi:hypothetical protein
VNEENEWDGKVDCERTEGPSCRIMPVEIEKAWKRSTLVPVYKGKGDPIECES